MKNKIKNKFLLVQGRALKQIDNSMQSFPLLWKEEFPLIKQLGFYGIEWIYDKKSEISNPILNEDGRKEMLKISSQNDIILENIVLDWFIFYPLLIDDQFTMEKKINRLILLINASAKAGFKRIILPLLEQNNISSDNKKKKFIMVLKTISKHLELNDIDMHLETSLSPKEEYQLLKEINHGKVKLCFDMGNSASEGYEPNIAIDTIKAFLGSVHIKDRLLKGDSVPLGKGSVKFYDVYRSLKKINYEGPYSFQVYRNKESDNISLLSDSLTFINKIMKEV